MSDSWAFNPSGPDTAGLVGPMPLASKAMRLPKTPAFYFVTCGGCLAHIGTSKNLANRVRTLATLGHHRGSDEVLCAAFCSGQPPHIWWIACNTEEEARRREAEFKSFYGEPPVPAATYASCKHGRGVRDALLSTVNRDSWEAGYIEAVFAIGERLDLLFKPRFDPLWSKLNRPPGPRSP